MALHVTPVANLSAPMPAAPVWRSAAGSTAGGSPAEKAARAAPEEEITSSFGSLLARSAVAQRPAVEITTTAGSRTAATSAPASSATTTAAGAGTAPSSTAGSSGLSDFELLFGGSSYNPAATSGTAAAASSTSAGAAGTAAASSSTPDASGLSDFELLFGGSSYNPADPLATAEAAAQAAAASAASAAAAAAPPTAQSVFGPNVWMTDPIGLNPDGSTFQYNPIYFATESTAQTVAQMIGGTVVTENVFTQPAGDPFVQQQPNYMVQMPNGALINPGLVASFYTFGFSQSQINTMIAQEVANTPPPAQST